MATKVRIPPLSLHTVTRKQLVDALEGGLPHHKLALISSPAGYGKTTLLTHWARASQFAVAWVSLEADDNDVERFLRYLYRAWEVIQPGIRESELGLLLEGMSPDSKAVLTAIINVATVYHDHVVFVLDDYHLITESAIHEAIAFLIDHAPPKLHFALAVRGEPALPLARYRARGALIELHAADLRFSPDETIDFLRQQTGLDLKPERIASIQTKTEGWAAGLQLVALALQRRLLPEEALILNGRQRFIADYLNDDVLEPLTAETRHFLLQTSILERLCGSLCDAVTGKDNSQRTLEALEREGLFLLPLDDQRHWFRYHPLFADFLQERLQRQQPDIVSELHRRAGRWYLEHDLPEQAFRHALAGSDVERLVQIIDLYLNAKVVAGEIGVVREWVDLLPTDWLATHPLLGLARAGLLAATGAFDDCLRCLDAIEAGLKSAKDGVNPQQLAKVTAVRCYVACFQNDLSQAEDYADRALHDLPQEDLGGFRGSAYVALGDTYRRNGYWEEAKQSYLKVLDVSYSAPFRFGAAHVYGALADLELRQGRLREAESFWRNALESTQNRAAWGRLPLPVIGWVYIRLGELQYEWNELAQAKEYVSRGLERAELGGDVRALIAGYLIAGRLKLAQNDTEGASDYLERARPLIERAQFADWISRFERFQLEVWLAQDRLRAAVEWSDAMLRNANITERPESEVAQLAMARVLIVKGDRLSIEQSQLLLNHLVELAEAEGRGSILIEALALRALAAWQLGERADAMSTLERALRLAEPEGYVRLFVDLGLPFVRLLHEAHTRDVMPEYVRSLLDVYGDALAVSASTALPEPLTEREQEILALLAAGLTNPEIAKQLVISPQTVKKHAGNIYGKLHVSNRTEAAARARKLDLLD